MTETNPRQPLPGLLDSKLQPPPMSGTSLERTHVLQLLDRARAYRLTLLLAPAGGGKTTLLGQWYRRLQGEMAVAWLSLDDQDNDVIRFFTYLLAAIRKATPRFQGYLYSHLSQEDLTEDYLVESLLLALQRIEEPLVIVLDDMQVLHQSSLLGRFKYCLDHLPSHVHVVMASRRHPDLPLSRYKLNDGLLLIDQYDLRFTDEDIADFGAMVLGEALDAEDIRHLAAVTEGWIAGVKLALLSGMGRISEGAQSGGLPALKRFSGSQQGVMEYLADVVFQHLPLDEQRFLLACGLFEQFCPALCDAVLGLTDSHQRLARLQQDQLFLQALDSQQLWWRFNPLFRDFLLARQRLDGELDAEGLRQRAATWYVERKDYHSALQLLAQNAKASRFVPTLAKAWEDWVKQGDFTSILHWSERIDETLLVQLPELSVPYIASLILARRFNQADYFLEQLQQLLRGSDRAGLAVSIAECDILALMLCLFRDDTTFIMREEFSVSSGSQYAGDLRSFFHAIRAYYLLLHLRFGECRKEAMLAREHLLAAGHRFLSSYADLILILADRAEGRMLEALVRAEETYATITDTVSPAWVNIATALAVVRYEQNDLQGAADLCTRLLPMLSQTCATEVIASVYITLARIKSLQGGRREAESLLRHLSRILQLGNYDRFTAQYQHEQVRMAYQFGDYAQVGEKVRQFGLWRRWQSGEWGRARSYDECWQRQGQAITYALMAQQQWSEAVSLLQNLALSALRSGCLARWVVLQGNIAVCHWALGEIEQSYRVLQQALAQSSLACFNRSFFDEAPGVGEVLRGAVNAGILPELPGVFVTLFGELLTLRGEEAVQRPDNGREPLTDKEQEIVVLLRAGLSNQDISERSGIALSTTKWHLKNIYAKLQVRNRTEAVLKFESQLLDPF